MRYLCQRNPNWASAKIGGGPMTLGQAGCTVTCLSMLLDYFGCFQTPPAIASHTDWFNDIGKVLWTKLRFDHMQFVWRGYTRDDGKIQAAIKDPNQAVLLSVNGGTHWVVALRKTLWGNSYVVADPWTGGTCDVLSKYHSIEGYALVQRI